MVLKEVSPSHRLCMLFLDMVVGQVGDQFLRLWRNNWIWRTEHADEIGHLQNETQSLLLMLSQHHLEMTLRECLYLIRAGW